MGLDYGSHSTYKYGDAPYSLGITSALNKLMNRSPYGFIGFAKRELYSIKPVIHKEKDYKLSFATDSSLVEMVNALVVSTVEKIEDANIIDQMSVYKGINFVSNTSLVSRWYEYVGGIEVLCELHSIPIFTDKEDDLMNVYLHLRESNSSNVVLFSSSYLYDNQLLPQLDYVQPFRYTPIITENFSLPTFFINEKLHIQSYKYRVEANERIGYRNDSYVLASLPLGENLPSGENVIFTANGEDYISDTDYDSIIFYHPRNHGSIFNVFYSYSGGSGRADFVSFHKLSSDKFPEPRVLLGDNQYVDNNTINAIIDTSENKMYNEYTGNSIDNRYAPVLFLIGSNGNFPMVNSPYDNTTGRYVYGGLSKYVPFSIYLER